MGNVASVGLQVQWEPFDWGRKKHEAASLAEQGRQAKLREMETADNIVQETRSTWRKLREAGEYLDVCRLRQRSARESVREMSVRYEQKTSLLRDVLDAQSARAGADDRLERALTQFWSARADFDRATGSRSIQPEEKD